AVGLGYAAELQTIGAQQDLRPGNHGPAAILHCSSHLLLCSAPREGLSQNEHQCKERRDSDLSATSHECYILSHRDGASRPKLPAVGIARCQPARTAPYGVTCPGHKDIYRTLI